MNTDCYPILSLNRRTSPTYAEILNKYVTAADSNTSTTSRNNHHRRRHQHHSLSYDENKLPTSGDSIVCKQYSSSFPDFTFSTATQDGLELIVHPSSEQLRRRGCVDSAMLHQEGRGDFDHHTEIHIDSLRNDIDSLLVSIDLKQTDNHDYCEQEL